MPENGSTFIAGESLERTPPRRLHQWCRRPRRRRPHCRPAPAARQELICAGQRLPPQGQRPGQQHGRRAGASRSGGERHRGDSPVRFLSPFRQRTPNPGAWGGAKTRFDSLTSLQTAGRRSEGPRSRRILTIRRRTPHSGADPRPPRLGEAPSSCPRQRRRARFSPLESIFRTKLRPAVPPRRACLPTIPGIPDHPCSCSPAASRVPAERAGAPNSRYPTASSGGSGSWILSSRCEARRSSARHAAASWVVR